MAAGIVVACRRYRSWDSYIGSTAVADYMHNHSWTMLNKIFSQTNLSMLSLAAAAPKTDSNNNSLQVEAVIFSKIY